RHMQFKPLTLFALCLDELSGLRKPVILEVSALKITTGVRQLEPSLHSADANEIGVKLELSAPHAAFEPHTVCVKCGRLFELVLIGFSRFIRTRNATHHPTGHLCSQLCLIANGIVTQLLQRITACCAFLKRHGRDK